MTAVDLAALVVNARVLLLDFDGPICAVFAGYSAATAAAELRQVLVDQGVTVPETMLTEADPLEIIRFTATLGRPALTHHVDDALRAAEVAAVRSATPTAYALEVIVAAHRTGRRISVVSNNAAEAVGAYLAVRRLASYVHPIIGRPSADPTRMKPNPAPLLAAIRELDTTPEQCLMVGDSSTDIDAAHAARVPVVGYANKPGKEARLARADTIITSMADLATALETERLQALFSAS